MKYTQDEIVYKIESGILKEWEGVSLFKKPTWNGTTIVEGWTQEDSYKQTENDREKKIAELEAAGVDVEYKDNTFHFTREMATQLLGATQLCEKLGAKNVEWKNSEGKFIKIPLSKSYTICGSALQKYIAIHKEN